MNEIILCAANYYDDGKNHPHQPDNINTGFVICGRRHSNCIAIFSIMFGFPYDDKAKLLKMIERQGFLTNKNRFVEREEAAQIAFEAGQITQHKIVLYSEDLY